MLNQFERTMLRDLKAGKCPEYYGDMVAVAQRLANSLANKGYIVIAKSGRRRITVVKS